MHFLNKRTSMAESKWFPSLFATFKTNNFINFVMDRIHGINIFDFQRKQASLKPAYVKYIAAKTLLILESLHENRIIFRDLKPEVSFILLAGTH